MSRYVPQGMTALTVHATVHATGMPQGVTALTVRFTGMPQGMTALTVCFHKVSCLIYPPTLLDTVTRQRALRRDKALWPNPTISAAW